MKTELSMTTILYIFLLIGAVCSAAVVGIGYWFIDRTQEPVLSDLFIIKGAIGLAVCIGIAVAHKIFKFLR